MREIILSYAIVYILCLHLTAYFRILKTELRVQSTFSYSLTYSKRADVYLIVGMLGRLDVITGKIQSLVDISKLKHAQFIQNTPLIVYSL